MAITALDLTLADLIPPDVQAQYTARSAGMHVSTVVRSLCSGLDPTRYPPIGGDRPHVTEMWELGLAFENLIAQTVGSRASARLPGIMRPGEISTRVDGEVPMIGTPDYLFIHRLAPFAPLETKLTWLSANHDIAGGKFQYFLWQLKTYMAMLGVPVGWLWIVHINGNYKYESGIPTPILNGYEITMTDREADEHWAMIQGEARRLVAQGVCA